MDGMCEGVKGMKEKRRKKKRAGRGRRGRKKRGWVSSQIGKRPLQYDRDKLLSFSLCCTGIVAGFVLTASDRVVKNWMKGFLLRSGTKSMLKLRISSSLNSLRINRLSSMFMGLMEGRKEKRREGKGREERDSAVEIRTKLNIGLVNERWVWAVTK